MNARLRRAYLPGDSSAQVHLRLGGDGPAVLLLADSPGSGAALTGLAHELIDSGHAVVVPDLIGAGGTTYADDLAGDLDAQARLARAALEGLGWRRTVVVGDGAGAAVGLRLAADRPDLVTGVAVLGAPYAGAAPTPTCDGTPCPYGEHLVRLWHQLRDQYAFTPYWRPDAAHRRRRAMPPTPVLHEIFADSLSHPTAHGRLAEAARRDWAALLGAAARPVVEVAAPGDGAAVRASLLKLPPAGPYDRASAPARARQGSDAPRGYVDVHYGQLHARTGRPTRDAHPTRPVLLLHANPGSGEGLEPLLAAFGRDRRAAAIDLPGHGRSDPLPAAQRPGATLAGTYVPVLLEAMEALQLDRVDVYGTHTGAGLAVELAIAAPSRVRSLVLDGVPLFDDDPALVSAVLAEYFVDLTPDRHGSHLVRAWNVTRDMALWWPWFRQDIDGIREVEPYPAATLQRVTADLLHSPTYAVSYRAAWTWPGSERLPLVTQPVLVGSGPTDPLRAMTPRAMALLRDGRETAFPATNQPVHADAVVRCVNEFTEALADGG